MIIYELRSEIWHGPYQPSFSFSKRTLCMVMEWLYVKFSPSCLKLIDYHQYKQTGSHIVQILFLIIIFRYLLQLVPGWGTWERALLPGTLRGGLDPGNTQSQARELISGPCLDTRDKTLSFNKTQGGNLTLCWTLHPGKTPSPCRGWGVEEGTSAHNLLWMWGLGLTQTHVFGFVFVTGRH
jgi:hypothetical protein